MSNNQPSICFADPSIMLTHRLGPKPASHSVPACPRRWCSWGWRFFSGDIMGIQWDISWIIKIYHQPCDSWLMLVVSENGWEWRKNHPSDHFDWKNDANDDQLYFLRQKRRKNNLSSVIENHVVVSPATLHRLTLETVLPRLTQILPRVQKYLRQKINISR